MTHLPGAAAGRLLQRRHLLLLARIGLLERGAFGRPGPKTSLLVLQDTTWQRVFRWVLLLASVGVVVWRIYMWLAPRFMA